MNGKEYHIYSKYNDIMGEISYRCDTETDNLEEVIAEWEKYNGWQDIYINRYYQLAKLWESTTLLDADEDLFGDDQKHLFDKWEECVLDVDLHKVPGVEFNGDDYFYYGEKVRFEENVGF